MNNNLDYLNRVYLRIDLDKICNKIKEVIKKEEKQNQFLLQLKVQKRTTLKI